MQSLFSAKPPVIIWPLAPGWDVSKSRSRPDFCSGKEMAHSANTRSYPAHLQLSAAQGMMPAGCPALWNPEPARRMLEASGQAAWSSCPQRGWAAATLLILELNLEQVLWDQWHFPRIKPLCAQADYPRPDVIFCSCWRLLHSGGMACLHLFSAFYCTYLSFRAGELTAISCSSTLFSRSSVSLFVTVITAH